ncbi:MAG: DUF5652 family protein [Pseudomonadales bacterium]|jgi:methionyl-tRNA synthetase|nr:DUF5652 family protein [Pseudomonadales bacterium]
MNLLESNSAGFGLVIVLIVVWSIFWKGLALWHAARKKQSVWFVVMLLINSVGILEIIYLLGVRKIKLSKLFGG